MANLAVIIPTDIIVVNRPIAMIRKASTTITLAGTVTQRPSVSDVEGVMGGLMMRHNRRIWTISNHALGHNQRRDSRTEVGVRKASKKIEREVDKVGAVTMGPGELFMAREAGRLKVSNTVW